MAFDRPVEKEKERESRDSWVRGFDHILPIDFGHTNDKGPIDKLIELLEVDKLDPNEVDRMGGIRPLHKAAARGYTEAVAVLLDHGADIDAVNNTGMTALALAETGDALVTADARALLIARGAKDIKAPKKKRFIYNPSGKSYWIYAEDENGNSNERNHDAEEVEAPAYARAGFTLEQGA